MSTYLCAECGDGTDDREPVWRCPGCGGLLELMPPAAFGPGDVEPGEPGFWRYARALPDLAESDRLHLGESMTPLLASGCLGPIAHLKLDHLLPTGSYKDRGAAVLVAHLRRLGVAELLEDSSGNAGAALAAHAAAAGLGCVIYAPAGTSAGKLAQIRAHGARLVSVEGDRAAVARAAEEAAGTTFYASHNRHPVFVQGV